MPRKDINDMRKTTALLAMGGLSLALAACTDSDNTASPAPEVTTETAPTTVTSSTAPSSPAEETEMVDPGEDAGMSEIGREAGFDCVVRGDCSVLFTVEAMDVLDTCPGYALDSTPADTFLVRMPILIKTKPSDFEYDPSTFAIWSEWSVETEEGINQPLPASTWCSNADGDTQWMEPIHVGDTVRHVHLMDVPVGATEIRLTETNVGSRWTFPAP